MALDVRLVDSVAVVVRFCFRGLRRLSFFVVDSEGGVSARVRVCVGVSVFESCFFFRGLKRLSFLVVELEAVFLGCGEK